MTEKPKQTAKMNLIVCPECGRGTDWHGNDLFICACGFRKEVKKLGKKEKETPKK